jgi:hypothetical protein
MCSEYYATIVSFSFLVWGETWVYLVHRSLIGLLYRSRMIRVWSSRWNENWQGKLKYSEKTCPGATLSTINPTWPDLGSNPGRRGGKPATNGLSYVMVSWLERMCRDGTTCGHSCPTGELCRILLTPEQTLNTYSVKTYLFTSVAVPAFCFQSCSRSHSNPRVPKSVRMNLLPLSSRHKSKPDVEKTVWI